MDLRNETLSTIYQYGKNYSRIKMKNKQNGNVLSFFDNFFGIIYRIQQKDIHKYILLRTLNIYIYVSIYTFVYHICQENKCENALASFLYCLVMAKEITVSRSP